MRWSYGDRYDADIEAAIERADEVDPGWVDQRNMVSRVQPTFLQQEAGNLLRSLVQLVAG